MIDREEEKSRFEKDHVRLWEHVKSNLGGAWRKADFSISRSLAGLIFFEKYKGDDGIQNVHEKGSFDSRNKDSLVLSGRLGFFGRQGKSETPPSILILTARENIISLLSRDRNTFP